MRSTLPDDGFYNQGAANGARLTAAAVNAKIILEVTTAVYPVDAGTIPPDSFLEYTLDGKPEMLDISSGKLVWPG